MAKSPLRIAILASGRGSNFRAIAQAVKSGDIPNTEIVALICNKANAPVLEHAKELQIPTKPHFSKDFYEGPKFHREAYEASLAEILKSLTPDYLILAGYTLLLGPQLVGLYPNRILNIHPSLLPAFKGLHAQRQALEAGVEWTGCTVHIVTAALDDGPILRQGSLKIEKTDTEASLTKRLLELEHETYVSVLKDLATKEMVVEGSQVKWK